jgi:hypothetical protein
MSQYIVKKAILDVKRECSNRSCGCYTEKGYYIKYTNRNVDGVLFVCEECFQKKYRSQCTVQDFSIPGENHRLRRSTEIDYPTVRRVIRLFNRTMRAVRYASLCLLIISTIFVGVLTREYHIRNVDVSLQSKSVQITEVLAERIDNLAEQVQYFFTKERSSK